MNPSIDINHVLPFLGVLLGGGVGVALASQAIKKAAGLNSGHVIHLMVAGVSVVAAVAQYVLQLKNVPVEVLGISFASIYGFSQVAYKESGYIKDFLGRIQIADANPAKAAQATAEVNAVSIPEDVTTEPEESAIEEFNA